MPVRIAGLLVAISGICLFLSVAPGVADSGDEPAAVDGAALQRILRACS